MSLKTEAVKLLKAEEAVKTAKGELEHAERERTKARERCRPLLATGVTTLAGDIAITVTPCVSGQSFRLAQYLRAHKLTAAMKPFVGDGVSYDRWTVKRLAA
jgi:hypothetical protein